MLILIFELKSTKIPKISQPRVCDNLEKNHTYDSFELIFVFTLF